MRTDQYRTIITAIEQYVGEDEHYGLHIYTADGSRFTGSCHMVGMDVICIRPVGPSADPPVWINLEFVVAIRLGDPL